MLLLSAEPFTVCLYWYHLSRFWFLLALKESSNGSYIIFVGSIFSIRSFSPKPLLLISLTTLLYPLISCRVLYWPLLTLVPCVCLLPLAFNFFPVISKFPGVFLSPLFMLGSSSSSNHGLICTCDYIQSRSSLYQLLLDRKSGICFETPDGRFEQISVSSVSQ